MSKTGYDVSVSQTFKQNKQCSRVPSPPAPGYLARLAQLVTDSHAIKPLYVVICPISVSYYSGRKQQDQTQRHASEETSQTAAAII